MSYPNQKKILRYIVKVKYGKTGEGSGVIIPLKNNDYSYVLTAKHTFGKDKKERGDDYYKIVIKDIEKSKITLFNPHKINLELDDILEINNIDNKIDLLILKVKNNEELNALETLKIFNNDFEYCLPYGFPNITKEAHTPYEPFECKHKPLADDLERKFEMKVLNFPNITENLSTKVAMSGLSGSGVYVKIFKDEIGLVGIVIKASLNNNVVCLDLQKLVQDINRGIAIPLLSDEVSIEKDNNIDKNVINIDEQNELIIETVNIQTEKSNIDISINPVSYHNYDIFSKNTKRKEAKRYFIEGEQGHYPVVYVSWEDANRYCEWLSKMSKKRYTLASKEEWQYIANKNLYDGNLESNYIWHIDNTGNTLMDIEKSEIGKLGIYDMLGNIYEWCSDSCDKDAKIAIGGSFKDKKKDINIKKTVCLLPFDNKNDIGFRIISKRRPMLKRLDAFNALKEIKELWKKMSPVGELDNKKLLSMDKNYLAELEKLMSEN